MAIMWSRIHAELGLSPRPLTHDMVKQAVARGVLESEDLDWKRDLAWRNKALPPEVREQKKWELAKDVAAMANSRGGLTVFGVAETNERPVSLVGVPNGEGERMAIRSFANKVRPLVDSLLIEALDGEDGDPGLIAMFVPPSPDAPHMISEKNGMRIPFRNGSGTEWMSEEQLERAYRDRFTRRSDDRAALSALIDGLVPEIDLLNGVWLAVAARPVASLPLLSGHPSREQATATMLDARELVSEVFGESQGRVPMLNELLSDGAINNPSNGLRRWVIQSNRGWEDFKERADKALVELHHDGSIALAVGSAGYLDETRDKSYAPWPVPVTLIDAVIAEAVALATTHVRRLGGVGTILTRAALLGTDDFGGRPLVVVTGERRKAGSRVLADPFRHCVNGSRPLRNPTPVEVTFSAEGDVVDLRSAARQLADDLEHQFGVRGSSIPM